MDALPVDEACKLEDGERLVPLVKSYRLAPAEDDIWVDFEYGDTPNALAEWPRFANGEAFIGGE